MFQMMIFGQMKIKNPCDVPESLWSSAPLGKPPAAPEVWVDQLADYVEINRLLAMGVLKKRSESDVQPVVTLTTRFVCDWRNKMHKSGTES